MERWKIEVEITFNPITLSSNEETISEALNRIHKVLSRMLNNEVELSHFHILKRPEKCIEDD